ncbi:MAG: exonuclease domain-containing protein [Planctomycetota bacterium]
MDAYAVIDVETTGLSPRMGDAIVELGVVVLDEHFRVTRLLNSLINPGRPIPSAATAVHGITNADVRTAPAFRDLLPEFLACLSGTTHFVAHNLPFDRRFLTAELEDAGVDVLDELQPVCTMKLARRQQVAANARLATVMHALGIPSSRHLHSALIDAAATARVLTMLQQRDPATPATSRTPLTLHAPLPLTSTQKPRMDSHKSLSCLKAMGLNFAR